MAFANQERKPRLPAIAGVTLVHVGLGYALLTGLVSADVIGRYLPPLIVQHIPLPAPAEPPPEPAKQRTETPPMQQPSAPERTIEVRLPTIPDLTLGRESIVTLTPVPPLPLPQPNAADEAPAAPQPSQAVSAHAKGARGAWITSEDYPPSALRSREAGIVGIEAAIDAEGRVFACTVTASSGSAALDATACKLYQKRGRFTPARDEAGRTVASTVTDRIRWQLPD
jgi:protein TonB